MSHATEQMVCALIMKDGFVLGAQSVGNQRSWHLPSTQYYGKGTHHSLIIDYLKKTFNLHVTTNPKFLVSLPDNHNRFSVVLSVDIGSQFPKLIHKPFRWLHIDELIDNSNEPALYTCLKDIIDATNRK